MSLSLRWTLFWNKWSGLKLLFLNADILQVTFLCYENVFCLMHDMRHEKAPKNITDLFTDT